MSKYVSDTFILLGSALIVYGAYVISPLAAVFTGGVALIALGVVVGLEGSR